MFIWHLVPTTPQWSSLDKSLYDWDVIISEQEIGTKPLYKDYEQDFRIHKCVEILLLRKDEKIFLILTEHLKLKYKVKT